MVILRTTIQDEYVEYTVERGDELLWLHLVHFDASHHRYPDDYAFRAVAKEQEEHGLLVAHPGESITAITQRMQTGKRGYERRTVRTGSLLS